MNALKVFIGYDFREGLAYDVAEASLRGRSSIPLSITPLKSDRLAASGLLRRPTDLRGQRYDLLSNAPAATEFAISRFMVPLLAQSGWSLFTDSDVVFLADIAELIAQADERYAVMCVKHVPHTISKSKMDNQTQTTYPRKWWSSLMLFNCDHPANRRLSLIDIQERRGLDLHSFYWCSDSEIGALPPEWNWLVGIQERPTRLKLAHFTNGGPFIPGWQGAAHDEIWYRAHDEMLRISDTPGIALVGR